MNKDDKIHLLSEWVFTQSTIECECGKIDGTDGDSDWAADEFYDKGWRAVGEKLYCKKCYKKRKKKNEAKKRRVS